MRGTRDLESVVLSLQNLQISVLKQVEIILVVETEILQLVTHIFKPQNLWHRQLQILNLLPATIYDTRHSISVKSAKSISVKSAKSTNQGIQAASGQWPLQPHIVYNSSSP